MAKKKISQKVLEYTAVFEPAEEGGFVVHVPALPGCTTQGDTFEDAQEMVKDAIKGYVAVLRETNAEIPVEAKGTVLAKVSINGIV